MTMTGTTSPPPANRVDEKLQLLAFALAELTRVSSASLSADDQRLQFTYHFGAFLGIAGALRQYFQDDLETGKMIRQKPPADTPGSFWFDDFNDQLDIATIIGLRNTDVHDLAVRYTTVNTQLAFFASTSFAASLRIRYERFDWVRARVDSAMTRLKRRAPAISPAPPIETKTASFWLDPAHLGPDFMKATTTHTTHFSPGRSGGKKYAIGDPLRMRSAAIVLLGAKDLAAIANDAYREIETRIVDARSRALIP